MATILVVDDVAANREFLVTLLRYKGHRLIEAADGREGLAAVHAEHPDLVITDVLMPVMDGYELVRQLRLDPATSGIPVVFYTAYYGEREARALALFSGVSYVVTKPAEPEEVLTIVGRVLSGESKTGMPPAAPLTIEFDREHMRLLTDKLSEKTGDLRTANARLRALINIGLELASERDANRLLQRVCAAARDLFGATYVTLGIVHRTDRTLQHLITCGTDATCGAAHWIKTGDTVPGILGTVVAERRTVRGDNPGGDPAGLPLPSLHPKVQAFVAAPIASPAHVYGWICLVGNEGRTFTEDDEQLVMALSGQVGRIYENGYFAALAQERAEELERERDRAQRYLDTADVILIALDMEGRITLVNRYACALLGWTASELLGRDWFEACVPPRLRDARRQKFEAGIEDLAIVENLILDRAGEERLIEWRHTVLRDDARIAIGMLSSGSDITERKKAESAVRHERDRAQRYLDTAEVLLLATDVEGRVTQINRKGCDVLGWTEEELLGRDFVEMCLPARIRTALRNKHESVLRGDVAVMENPILTRSGEERIIEWHNVVQRDDAGHVVGTLSSGTDITERSLAADALRTAEERIRFALQNANVGIWDMDFTTGVLRWSEIIEAHYGLRPGTFGGTFENFVERIHPDDRDSVLETVARAMKSGTDFSTLNRSIWPDGTVRWLTGSGRVLLGEHGEPVRGVGISLDVTERRTLEEQYQQAQKMEAVGRLAGGVAHDFNNLLTVILGYCDLLLADFNPADPRHEDIAEMQKAGARASGLTRQLLAFSRKQIIEPTLLDLNQIATDMEVMVARLIGEDVTVVLIPGRELAPVKADRGQVEQIVMNLAVNARDAMPTGGTLTIETANVDLDEHYGKTHLAVKPGPYVVLTLTDTGTGMTPEVQARLFEPFFTTKEPGKGTGLGMATVYGIVARSGGTVGVYSEVGKGTSIKVYFPRADITETIVETPAPAVRPHAGTQTVLVVEDEEGLRSLARKLLERQGYTVLVAAGAKEALRLFEENPSIDVLLTDVVMPGASGPELTRQLVELRPGLKVIYMSGYTEDAIVQHGVLKPGISFLNKPFTSQTLGQKIRDVLER